MKALRFLARLLAIAILMANGCVDSSDSQRTNSRAADSVVMVPQRNRTGMDTTGRSVTYPSFADDTAQDPAVRSDTTGGTLVIEGSGVAIGRWKFYDVTASFDEQVGGGTTRAILQLEAHRASPSAHFKFRLVSARGDIRPGTFSLNARDADPAVEASWELDGSFYRHLNGNGVVVVEEFDGKRIKGHFALHLGPVNPESDRALQQLSGAFDQAVLR